MAYDDFHKHDNIDRDIIEVSKDTLRLRLEECAKYAAIPAEAVGFGGMSLTLLAAAFLTEGFYDVWTISGGVVQSAFLLGGVVTGYKAIRKGMQWYREKEDFSPVAIIRSFTPKKDEHLTLLLPAPPPQKKARRSSLNTADQGSVQSKQKF